MITSVATDPGMLALNSQDFNLALSNLQLPVTLPSCLVVPDQLFNLICLQAPAVHDLQIEPQAKVNESAKIDR